VLKGDKSKVSGGSGRVLNSGANDRVFVSHEGHGCNGLLEVGSGDSITVRELNHALKYASKKKLFKELTYYVMACESGSMFEGHLDPNGNIYVLTAAKPGESTTAYQNITFMKDGEKLAIWINTEFGHAWLSDSIANGTTTHSLENQYKIVYPQVESFPSQYGNLNITNELVSNFEGVNGNKSEIKAITTQNKMETNSLPIAPIAAYIQLKRKLQNSKSSEKQQKLTQQLNEMEKERAEINQKVDTIVNSLTVNGNHKFASLKQVIRVSHKMITQVDCHHVVAKTIYKKCKKIIKSPFRHDFITPMVNLCEYKFDKDAIVAQIQKYCEN